MAEITKEWLKKHDIPEVQLHSLEATIKLIKQKSLIVMFL